MGQMYIAFSARPVWRGSMAVILEQSDDGVEWMEASSYTFEARGARGHVDQVGQAKDRLRVRWSVTAGIWGLRVDVGAATHQDAAHALGEAPEGQNSRPQPSNQPRRWRRFASPG